MKLALLNLTLDSNYGGNLQRYALVKVLQGMGHDVTHLSMHYVPHVKAADKAVWYVKRLIKKTILDHTLPLSFRDDVARTDLRRCRIAKPFYEKYIPHTTPIHSKQELCRYLDFDAYVVGSDQVWRPVMTSSFGMPTYFLDFLPDDSKALRIAYGVSMGVAEREFDDKQLPILRPLYKKFDAVSVRESSSLQILRDCGWTLPEAQCVLDPTLLLDKHDYEQLIIEGETHASEGDMFCYILDLAPEKLSLIKKIAHKRGLRPFFQIGYTTADSMSIPQWLRSFRDAKFVVTDSFHGFVFSLIFGKPAKVILNEKRGNARFDSLASILQVDLNDVNRDWTRVYDLLCEARQKSMSYLHSCL